MKTKLSSILGTLSGATLLLGGVVTADAAAIMRSPTGFTGWVTVTDFDDGDLNFTVALGPGTLGAEPVPLLGTVEWDAVNLNKDVHARGAISIMDNPLLGIQETFDDDLVFSGALQIDNGGAFSFDGVNPPQGYPNSWTLSYDGTVPESMSIFPMMPPLPALPGEMAGSLTFTVQSIGVDSLVLSVAETVGTAPGWNGFENYLALFDAAGVPFGGTPGIIDGALSIAPGSEINTPLPAAVWLLGSALLGLVAVTRRRSA